MDAAPIVLSKVAASLEVPTELVLGYADAGINALLGVDGESEELGGLLADGGVLMLEQSLAARGIDVGSQNLLPLNRFHNATDAVVAPKKHVQNLTGESERFAGLFSSADQKEGMAAFIEKRDATFTGR